MAILPGQYFDAETGLHQNWHRDYDVSTGRYLQSDPIGLEGGLSTYGYVAANPLKWSDSAGLFTPQLHQDITQIAMNREGCREPWNYTGWLVSHVDFLEGSQDSVNSFWHGMRDGKRVPEQSAAEAATLFDDYLVSNVTSCSIEGLARALHAIQDSAAGGHEGFQPWRGGIPSGRHIRHDKWPSSESRQSATKKSQAIIRSFQGNCPCVLKCVTN